MSGGAPLNLAMLGTGRIADTQLAPALTHASGARLWSVLSRDPARAAQFADRHGAQSSAPAHTSLDTLLADDDLDAVVIATPDKLHAGQAIAAARAGKHVLTEKPMATSVGDADAMVAACREAGVQLGVAYHLRWHEGHRLLVKAVRSGKLGDLRHMRVQWTSRAADDTNWRAQSNVGRWWSLAGVGTHCLDLIRWIMRPTCGEVRAVESVIGQQVWRGPHDETAVAALQFENGATAELCSSVLFDAPKRLEVYGSEGYMIGTDTLGAHGGGEMSGNEGDVPFTPTNPFVGELEDFAEAVRDNRPPEVDGIEGCRNIELLLRISN